MDAKEAITKKLTSGRYMTTMMLTVTYCATICGSVYLVIIDKLTVETFLGLFAAFSTLAGTVIRSYYERQDRSKEVGK